MNTGFLVFFLIYKNGDNIFGFFVCFIIVIVIVCSILINVSLWNQKVFPVWTHDVTKYMQ